MIGEYKETHLNLELKDNLFIIFYFFGDGG